jgi:hypothetical protein
LAGMRYEVIVGLGCSGEFNIFPSRSSLTRHNKTRATHMVSALDVWLPWAGGGRFASRLYCSQLFVRQWSCICHESVPPYLHGHRFFSRNVWILSCRSKQPFSLHGSYTIQLTMEWTIRPGSGDDVTTRGTDGSHGGYPHLFVGNGSSEFLDSPPQSAIDRYTR